MRSSATRAQPDLRLRVASHDGDAVIVGLIVVIIVVLALVAAGWE